MLLHRCKCGALIPQELRLCPDCEAKESDKMSRHMEYNLRRRNKKAAAFYVSAEWRKVRAFALSLYDSLDMECSEDCGDNTDQCRKVSSDICD